MESNRRRYERYEIVAQVEMTKGDEILVFTARNLSVGGIYVEAALSDHPQIVVGTRFEITIGMADASDAEVASAAPPPAIVVHSRGKVVRRDPGNSARPPGFGIVFEDLDARNLENLRALLQTWARRGPSTSSHP